MKKFEALLKSEVKKVERAINKETGFNNCKLTAYCSKVTHPFDFDPDCTWVEVDCEICRDYEEVVTDYNVHLSIPMFDRRKSFVTITRL